MIEGFISVVRRTRRSLPLSYILFKTKKCLLVIGATVVHPVTFRTRQLRPSAPMVLGGRPPGRVGHCQETFLFNLNHCSLTAVKLSHLCQQHHLTPAIHFLFLILPKSHSLCLEENRDLSRWMPVSLYRAFTHRQ